VLGRDPRGRTVFSFNAAASRVDIEATPFLDVGNVFSGSTPAKSLHKVIGLGVRGVERREVVSEHKRELILQAAREVFRLSLSSSVRCASDIFPPSIEVATTRVWTSCACATLGARDVVLRLLRYQ
jgi:hypothetical protein